MVFKWLYQITMKDIAEIIKAAGESEIASKRQFIDLLPILEHDWTEDINSQIRSVGLNPDAVVVCALSEGSDYWRGLAIKWLQSGYPLSERLADTLESLGNSVIGTQEDRDVALKLAAEWQKGND
ncbi:hypothetical protein BVX97_04020 [bacterium E08(2017)]|nr:hypothetical protein BVX97_04020 [bacterium E08(2017)]